MNVVFHVSPMLRSICLIVTFGQNWFMGIFIFFTQTFGLIAQQSEFFGIRDVLNFKVQKVKQGLALLRRLLEVARLPIQRLTTLDQGLAAERILRHRPEPPNTTESYE